MILKTLLLLTLLTTSLLAKNQAILKLDTQGHSGLIRDIIITKDKEIITASVDKTIRVWDQSGYEKRKILGQIGNGSEGMIYAIALSKDEKYLAVGGYFDDTSVQANINHGVIRIYNYKSGKLVKSLRSHTSVVNDLAFSEDDKYLISGSSDNKAKIWDRYNNFKLQDTITFHTKQVNAVKIIKKQNKYFAVTAGLDNYIALYDLENKKIIKSDKNGYKLHFLAATSNIEDGHIAVCGYGKEIQIYDFELNFIKKIKSETQSYGLKYSKNGDFLISGANDHPMNVNIYNAKESYTKKTTFSTHSNTIMGVGFLDKNTAVSGGGSNNEIYTWDIHSGKIKSKIQGVGHRVWSVGIKDDKIFWGSIFNPVGDYHDSQSTVQKSISLKNFKIEKSLSKNFNMLPKKNGSYSLYHSKGGEYDFEDAILDIKKDGKIVKQITKNSSNGHRHNCYGWYKDFIISGGGNGQLKVFDIKGKEIASLDGHTGGVWALALDGDRLITGSADQTIRVWDLNQLEHGKVGLVSSKWFNKAWISWIDKTYKNLDINQKEDIEILYENLLRDYGDKEAKKLEVSKKLEPILNIFISNDDEYIIWSQLGYFTSSIGGDKYVGYHINEGNDKEGRYVSSDKYFDTLYRPDIIENIIKTSSEKKAIRFASRTKEVKKVDIASSLPPIIYLVSKNNITTTKSQAIIEFRVESKEYIEDIIITQNGKKINTRALKVKKNYSKNKKITIDLEDGKNIISISARNKFARSDEVYVNIIKSSKVKDIFKPTLYLLSIGVSEYKNKQYNLGVAHKDAQSISKMFKKQKGKIYKDVVVKTLTNQNATSDDILDGLDWIDKEATSKDVVIIFIAGHGVNDEKGNYYFLSHEANLDKIRRTAVKWIEIEDTMSNLPSKVILLADTCHSGNIAGKRRDITSAVKSITNSGSGSIIMTATTGSGYSYEQDSWGHGAFTLSLIEGIDKAKADYSGDGVVTIKEIDLYVTNRVKTLTKGKQKPTTIVPKSVPDFAISIK